MFNKDARVQVHCERRASTGQQDKLRESQGSRRDQIYVELRRATLRERTRQGSGTAERYCI